MTKAAEVLKAKLLMQGEQIKFLEFVWNDLPVNFKDTYINNYKGVVPKRYTR